MFTQKIGDKLDKKSKKNKKSKDHVRVHEKKDNKQKDIQDVKSRQEKFEQKNSGERDIALYQEDVREQVFNSGDDDKLVIKPPPVLNRKSRTDRHGLHHYDQMHLFQHETFDPRNNYGNYNQDPYRELEHGKYKEKRFRSDERRSNNNNSCDPNSKGHSRNFRYMDESNLYTNQGRNVRENKSFNTSKISSRNSNDWQEMAAMSKSKGLYDDIGDAKKSHSTSSNSDQGNKTFKTHEISNEQLEVLDRKRHHSHEKHKRQKQKEKDVGIETKEISNTSSIKGNEEGGGNKTRTSSDDLKDSLALAYDSLILANKEKSRRSRRNRHQTPPGKSAEDQALPVEVHGSDSESTASQHSRTNSYAAAVGTSPPNRDRDDVMADNIADYTLTQKLSAVHQSIYYQSMHVSDERDSASPVELVDRRDENRFAGLGAPPPEVSSKSRTEEIDKGRCKVDDFYIEDNKHQPFYLSHEKKPKYANSPRNNQGLKPDGLLNVSSGTEMEVDQSSTIANQLASQQNGSTSNPMVAVEETPVQPDVTYYYPAYQGCRSVEEYQCLNRIEEGTYGVVYRAKNKKTNEIVALKRLKMEKEKEGFPITSLREINTLMKAHHKNVVSILEIVVGSNMDKIYIVMEFIEHDLKSLMETMKKPFLIGEVKTLLIQLIRGVHHLHDNWILHRDIKASNILLSHTGILKLGDFGLAREYGSPLKPYTPVVVTLWYRSPELLLGVKEYSTAVDMWSVGCLMGELLTLKPLFQGKSEVDQLNKIFKDLGTPSETIWPGYNDLPMVKKINFVTYPYNSIRKRLAGSYLSEAGFELLNKLLTYDPARRAPADEALGHEFFSESPLPVNPALLPTFPAKSEMYGHNSNRQGHSTAAGPCAPPSPKPPSGGKQYESVMKGEDFNYEDSLKVPARAPLLPPQLHHIRQSKAQAYLFQSMSAIASSSSTSTSIEISEKSVSGLFQGKPAPEHRPGPGFNLKF